MAIEYRVLVADDKEQTIDIIRTSMITDETLCRSIGVTPADIQMSINLFGDALLVSGLSIGAFDTDTGQLVGARLSLVKTPSTPRYCLDINDPLQEKMAKIERINQQVQDKIDIFQETGVDEIVYFMCLIVREDFRRQGIARRLIELALSVCKNNGFKAVTCFVTSNYSRKIYDALGFKTLAGIRIEDFKMNGEVVFKNTYPHEWDTLHCFNL